MSEICYSMRMWFELLGGEPRMDSVRVMVVFSFCFQPYINPYQRKDYFLLLFCDLGVLLLWLTLGS